MTECLPAVTMGHEQRSWQVPAESQPAAGGIRRRLLSAALVFLLGPATARAGDSQALSEQLMSTASQLQRGWLSDPGSMELPFPTVQILKDAASLQAACPDRADLPLATRALYCPSRAAILIDASAFGEDSDSGAWPLRYWLAIGLAEAIRALTGNTSANAVSAAVSSLESQCIAGILLAASDLTAGQPAEEILVPALMAYPLSDLPMVGSDGQRGYALLTGLGATEVSCSRIDMQALSQNRVPDPQVLRRVYEMIRAHSSLMAVLNSQCRPRPRASCPRRLPSRSPAP